MPSIKLVTDPPNVELDLSEIVLCFRSYVNFTLFFVPAQFIYLLADIFIKL